MADTRETPTTKSAAVKLLVRSLLHLVAVLAATVWGVLGWPLPLPGALIAVGCFVGMVLVWALFLSPRAVLRTDRFAHSLIELVFIACGVAALLAVDVAWPIAAIYGVAGAVLGFNAPPARK